MCIQVRIGDRSYDIPLEKVEKILSNPEVIPVPDAPEYVVGISIYEGVGVPFLRLQNTLFDHRIHCGILLAAENRGMIGIAVDEACQLREIWENEVWEQADEEWKEIWGGLKCGKADG